MNPVAKTRQTAYALVRIRRQTGGSRIGGRVFCPPLVPVAGPAPVGCESAIGVAEVARLSGLPAHAIERLTAEGCLTHLSLPGIGVYYYWSEVRRDLEAFRHRPCQVSGKTPIPPGRPFWAITPN